MFEWVKEQVPQSPHSIAILKEVLVVIDARPLYHWPEMMLDFEVKAVVDAEAQRLLKEGSRMSKKDEKDDDETRNGDDLNDDDDGEDGDDGS